MKKLLNLTPIAMGFIASGAQLGHAANNACTSEAFKFGNTSNTQHCKQDGDPSSSLIQTFSQFSDVNLSQEVKTLSITHDAVPFQVSPNDERQYNPLFNASSHNISEPANRLVVKDLANLSVFKSLQNDTITLNTLNIQTQDTTIGHADSTIIMNRDSTLNLTTTLQPVSVNIPGHFIADGGTIVLSAQPSTVNTTSDQIIMGSVSTTGKSTAIIMQLPPTLSTAQQDQGRSIKVIRVNGESAPLAFHSANIAVHNQHEYILQQEQGDWHFTNMVSIAPNTKANPTENVIQKTILRADAGAIIGHQQSVLNLLVPGYGGGAGFNERQHNLKQNRGFNYNGEIADGYSVWSFVDVRSGKGDATSDGQVTFKNSTTNVTVGIDKTLEYDDNSAWQFGLLGGYSTLSSSGRNIFSTAEADNDAKGMQIGAYATWHKNFYAAFTPTLDFAINYGMYDNDVQLGNHASSDYQSRGWTASVTAAYPFLLVDEYVLSPQLQLTYANYSADDYQDHVGTTIKQSYKKGLIGRVGAHFIGQYQSIRPYAAVNLWYNAGQSNIQFNGADVAAQKVGASLEVKAGFEMEMRRDWTLSAEASGRKSKNNHTDIGLQMGIKYSW